ncbi:unnamed protein product [Vitrella brassicaformis CCMP3155]|uniref:Pectate lyase superfamily protein domain-containing protein n=2 Tax=Vitrella brassicaformis TaxID=1169539 RepID=A0A0G4ESX3_VITBC|nr:unnamed protein product [Vitrella brassicaformis CCMP3155]|eukprot:CEM01753.1 unnamed protein product [Vitrella brassicaformis CCMP3155]
MALPSPSSLLLFALLASATARLPLKHLHRHNLSFHELVPTRYVQHFPQTTEPSNAPPLATVLNDVYARVYGRALIPPRPRYSPERIDFLPYLKTPSGVLPISDFGGDPTGKNDSSAAFERAIDAALPLWNGRHLAEGIKDLGGATLTLDGGIYLISRPLYIPGGYGNMHWRDGSIVASESFPADGFIITVGASPAPHFDTETATQARRLQIGDRNQFMSFSDLYVDGRDTASGVLRFTHTIGAVVGPANLFIGFHDAGVLIEGGHEFFFGDPRKPSQQTAAAIRLLGNDHVLRDVVIFSAKIGVEDRAGANTHTGVHSWNGSGTAMLVTGYSTRILDSYPDFNSIIVQNPNAVTITGGFFLGGAQIILRAHGSEPTCKGLLVRDNQFSYTDRDTVRVEGNFTKVVDTFVGASTIGRSAKLKTTRAVRQLHKENATEWLFDFSDVLVSPSIARVMYSMEIEGDGVFVRHASRPADGNRVRVETDVAVTATVIMEVDQSELLQGGVMNV